MSSDVARAIAPGSIKVCGLRRPEDAVIAAAAGAAMVSMIFAPSRRQIDPVEGRAITDAVHEAAPSVRTVGVFVDASADEINATITAAGLDLVQLSGDEPPAVVAGLTVPAIRAMQALPGETAADLARRARSYVDAPVPPVALLVDGYHPTERGGTGLRADWGLVAELGQTLGVPVGLAGGLTADNVADAIRQVWPLFVDVSGGVETEGVKDPERIRAFVVAARAAFDRE